MDYVGEYHRGYPGDTRSLNYSSSGGIVGLHLP